MKPSFLVLIAILAIWDFVWKALALWRCGRNNQPRWFMAVLLINSFGILPIIYLKFYQKNKTI